MNVKQQTSQLAQYTRSDVAAWSAVLLVAALAIQPLLGAPPRGHDAFLHYYRIPVVSEMWRHGMLFSRWAPDLIYGYGSPLFTFYPPLSAYLLTVLYWLAGQNGPLAYTLSYAVALVVTAVSMFLLGRRLFGSLGGLLASAAYTWSPHLLLQTYSRGSLSNALAMAFAPLAAFALLSVAERPAGRRVAFAAAAVALVLLSHTASGFLFLPGLLLLGFGASRLLYSSRPAPVLAALLLGLALSAFSWLPGLGEIGATRYAASVEGGGAVFADHFASVLTWPEQTIAGLAKTPQPHSPGLIQLLLAAAAVILVPLLWRRERHAPATRRFLYVGLSALAGFALLFLSTPASNWFWENLPPLRQVQFPWRLLDLPVLLLALAAAWWVTVLQPRGRPWFLGASLILMFLNAVPYLYPARLTALPQQPTLADATLAQQEYGILGLTAWGEYSSDAVKQWPAGPPFEGADQGAPLHMKILLPQSVALHSARGGSLDATWEMSAAQAATVTLSVHGFPGWRAELDGSEARIGTDEQGRMQFSIPAGRHSLALQWTYTPLRFLADALSLLALAGVGWLGIRARWLPRAKPLDAKAVATLPLSTAAFWLPLVVLACLFLLKRGIIDRANTPLVVHPDSQQIPGVVRPAQGDFGVFRLLGYELSEPDLLALYWYAPEQVEQGYTVRVTLADALGVPVKEIDNPYPGDNPTTGWEAGMLVRDVYKLPLDERPAPFAYYLSVAVLDPDNGEALPMSDGPPGATTVGVGALKVEPGPVAFPDEAQTLDAPFGGAIVLTHVQAPDDIRRGEPLSLTLYWASQAPVNVDYTIFVHLLRANGEFIAAFDAPPLDGLYPTSFWSPGERIADARVLELEVPPGDYVLQAGLYDPESGARVPLAGSPSSAADTVTLASFEVRE